MIQFSVFKQLNPDGATPHVDFSFHIKPGENIGITGPSGSGKTTLLKILAGLVTPDSGKLQVEGETWFDSAQNINRPPQHRDIGFVFQDYALFPNMTVRENLEFAFSDGIEYGRLGAVMEMLDISAIANQRPETLSGGQKQRVALGRALIRRPKLLLLDEPLSALDPEMRSKLQQDLKTVASNFDGVMILVSHDPAEIMQLTDQVVVLESGRIERSGTPAGLFLSQTGQEKQPGIAEIINILPKQKILIIKSDYGMLSIPFREHESRHLQIGDKISIACKDIEITKC